MTATRSTSNPGSDARPEPRSESQPKPWPEYGPVMGIAVPQANTTVEPEMQCLLGASHTVLTARMTSAFPDSRQRLVVGIRHQGGEDHGGMSDQPLTHLSVYLCVFQLLHDPKRIHNPKKKREKKREKIAQKDDTN